ncbi:MAG: TolC family protein [Proteobacteria bacterium]|nr:TolC family protein [Pseudomonadota bacterium]
MIDCTSILRRPGKTLALLAAGLLCTSAGMAQAPRTLTLAEAKRLAFARNWDLLAAKSDVDAALAQKLVAKEFPNPTLSLSTAKISFDDHPNGTTAGNSVWNRSFDNIIAVNQLFEIGGKRQARRESAVAGVAGAEARLRDARRVLDQGVSRAYVTVLQARDNVAILNQSVTSLRSEARIAEVRHKAGDISLADKMQIEIAAERLAQDASAAAAAERAARIAVDVLLGEANSSGDWVPGDSMDTLVGLPFPASAESPGLTRPDIQAAQAAERKAEADLRLARANRVPDPTFTLQYEHEQPDKPNTIGLAVSIPLPLWNRNEGNIAAARVAITAAKVQSDKLRAQIAADIAAARVAYEEASGRLQRYRDQIRPKSEQVRKTVAFAYEKGGASLLDLLSAERNDNDVRLATAAAAADAATAAVNLKAALNFSTESEPK